MQSLVVYFTHVSLVLSVRYRLITASRTLQAKGEMCTLQTGKLCYHAINISAWQIQGSGPGPPPYLSTKMRPEGQENLFWETASPPPPPPPHLISRSGSTTEYQLRPCACVCAELQESSISRLSWSFVKESDGLFIPQKLRSGVYRISQQSYESYIILRDRIVELAWSKVSTKVCGFKFGSIKLHSSSGDSIDLLSRTFCTTMVVSDLCITKQQFARRHVRHIGLSTRSNGGHVGVTNQSCGS